MTQSRGRGTMPSLRRGLTVLLPIALLIGCLPVAGPTPITGSGMPATGSPTGTVRTLDLANAIKFRTKYGLRADEFYVRSVFDDPTATNVFGTPLLPQEVAILNARALSADEVATVVKEYGRSVPDRYGGVYIDSASGVVYGMFVGDTSVPGEAIAAQLSPLAKFQVLPAQHTLDELLALMEAINANGAWFEHAGATVRAASLSVENNNVLLVVRATPKAGIEVIYERLSADPSSLAITVDDDPRPYLPRGSLRGIVVDDLGRPVTGRNLDISAVGDIGNYEPDGGVGIGTELDGTFVIERLAEMGWTLTVRDPKTGATLGDVHVVVSGGHTTEARIVLRSP